MSDLSSQNSDTAAASLAVREISNLQRIRAIVVGSTGNLIEWYDFYVYAFMALHFASSFFPEGDRTAQLLNVAGIYAAGFLIRPLGGWYFGRYADRHGRKSSIVFSILLMGGGSALIAFLPTHATIGAAAPLALLLARLIQGFSTGGLYGASATYLSEVATKKSRGFYASFHFVTLIGGQLAALFVLIVIQQFFKEEEIHDWAWRIPFALGALLAVAFVFLRHGMHETNARAQKQEGAGSLQALFRHPGALFIVVSLTASGAVVLYGFTTYMQKFLVNTAGMDIRSASYVMTGAMVVFMLLQPIIGCFSDIIGRRKCLLIFTSVMTFSAVPIFTALESVQNPYIAFALVALALTILSFYTSVSGLFKAELFPAHVRALGVGLAHSFSAAVFGGSAEYIALWFKQAGHESWFYWYMATVCALSFSVAVRMTEPTRADMIY